MKLNAYLSGLEVGDGFLFLRGWVSSANGEPPIEPLTIVVNGQSFSPIPLEHGDDPNGTKQLSGKSFFLVSLPVEATVGMPRIVLLDANGTAVLLTRDGLRPREFKARGAIDTIGPEGISGWIFDPAVIIRGQRPIIRIDGESYDITVGFDRSDVPLTFFRHPKRFGFHLDAHPVAKALSSRGQSGNNKPITIELHSSDRRFVARAELQARDIATTSKPPLHANSANGVKARPDNANTGALPMRAPNATGSIEHAASNVTGERPTMLVVSWDMGHNPLGRAYLLADVARRHFDVKLIGPLFEQYGKTIWNPLAEQNQIELKTFPGGPLVEFLPSVIEQVEKSKADIVYVSKPRLPSLIFGLLMRLRYGTPMIVDVDDHELSFFPNETPLSMDDAIKIAAKNPADAKMPYANVWTQLSEHLLQFADGITVSNIALQKRFGGVIVRHARDETTFSVSRARRSEVRKEFGLGEADVAIVFVGTPRPHKGIFRIAESLERLNDRRLVFVVVGSITDARTKNQFKKYKNARIKFFENQPWSRLPELVSMADLVAILQDPTSKISQFQIPAKLTDAMALGVPILATRVAPFADLFASDVLLAVDEDADLDGLLQSVSDVPTAFQAWARRARTLFISEFSYAVNSARIKLVAEEARNTELSSNDAIANTLAKLFDYAGVPFPYGGRSKVVASPAIKQGARRRDVVFFWKQNDSDIYGRRSDMLVKYLLRSEKVGRVVHFDHALTLSQLEATVDHSPHAPYHQGNLVYLNSVQRILKMADRGPIFRRTFLCRAGSAVQSFLGMELPPRSQYAEFVKQTLKECGIEECPIAWVWPVVFDFPTIHDHVKFDKVIVDIIDDQRKWNAKPEYMRRVEQNYVDVLKLADAVFVNCEPVREGFSDLRDDIVVVPNGAETFSSNADWQAPDDLARLPRPVIGYVGNLRDRIDFKLIDDLARRHPEWSIVLIGSAQGALEVFSVAERQNVHLLGVRRYEEAVRYIKNFDVAIMPHLDTELSQNMNPLKLYVYFSLGVPIVTTEVANIGDLHSHVAVAKTHDEFVAAVERAVRGEFAPLSDEKRSRVIGEVSWVARVNAILSRVGL